LPHRRFDLVSAPGYLGRKRGEVARTRTTILQAHTHQWLGTFGNAGNGDYRGELRRARAVIESYATSLSLPLSHVLTRLDGLYGNAAPLADLLAPGGPGVVVRGKDYHLLDLPTVQKRLHHPPDQETIHPESGVSRALFDCLHIPLTPTGPIVRMLLATHPASASPPSIGTLRHGIVSEQFFSTGAPTAFTPADVLDLALPIEGPLRRCSPTKIRSKTRTAGFLIRPVGKSSGKSSTNGFGTFDWSSGSACHLPVCV